jgi:hypothetical protein
MQCYVRTDWGFDAVAWGMAHFKDTEPTRPKSVYFPICIDEKQWKKALNDWVGEINPEFQERLRIMQPFTYMQTGGVSVLSMLHELDIQDKHRDILTVSADIHEINLGGSFEYEDHDIQAVPRIEMFSDVRFSDGVVLGTLHAGAPIRTIGQMILRPAMKVQLTYRDTVYDVMPMLQQFLTEARRSLDILLSGLAGPHEPDEAEWSPMEMGLPPVCRVPSTRRSTRARASASCSLNGSSLPNPARSSPVRGSRSGLCPFHEQEGLCNEAVKTQAAIARTTIFISSQ